ncbi:MAG: hypothetical protein V1917_00285 [Candidatus Gottesmanbacteria bacterium]
MSARKPTLVGVVLFFFFVFPFPVFSAVSFTPLGVDTTTPIIGDSFIVQASASGAVASSLYYVKCRIGPNTSSLAEGQTFNANTAKWLDDTSAWIDMPQVTTGDDGSWQGSITCRIKSSAVDEAKLLFVRACLTVNSACGSSFQSTSSLGVMPRAPTPTATPTPTVTNTPTLAPTATTTPTSTPIVMSSPTNSPTPTVWLPSPSPSMDKSGGSATIAGVVLGKAEEQVESTQEKSDVLMQKKPYIISLVFVGLGFAMLGAVYVIKIRLYSK